MASPAPAFGIGCYSAWRQGAEYVSGDIVSAVVPLNAPAGTTQMKNFRCISGSDPSPLSPIARAMIHPTATRLWLPGPTRASALDLSSPRHPLQSPSQQGGPAKDAPRNGSMKPLTKEASLPRSMASSTSAQLPKLPTPGVDI